MESIKTSNRIHPLIAAAAVAVLLVSLVGVAAITGILPTSHSSNAPTASMPAPASPDSTAPGMTAPADPRVAANQTMPANPRVATNQTMPANPPAAPVNQHRAPHTAQHAAPAVAAQGYCENCGRVESVQAVQEQAKPSGLGVMAGAVLGGVLGNQVGNGNGRTLATVAGAVGGGYAGNEVEKRARSTVNYQVKVRMEDGSVRSFSYATQPAWGVGDHVKVIDGALTARG